MKWGQFGSAFSAVQLFLPHVSPELFGVIFCYTMITSAIMFPRFWVPESQHTVQTVFSCRLLDDCSFLFTSIFKVFLTLSFFWIPSFPLLQVFFLPFLFFMCSFISFSQVQLFQGCQLLFSFLFCAPGLSFSSVYSLSVWLWCFLLPPPSPVSLMPPWALSFALPLFFSSSSSCFFKPASNCLLTCSSCFCL